ncbi:dTDP-glucose 4,6-dehydratase [Desulfobacter hydrogenophilus]|uniref:dTDP-glucose 4,6-dehydratase n=2 Tax=Desulfobacter hydrogenophilus TaxID=2291 RepID=A0A328FF60_9BACT|nr:dTDP-glucose 4,6-dehydratase [Desulfobacter hydrogenophilus]QBH15618.1 dTDP-glucose 4,6-dehydratase [Desulfobacter hydrogenophilus]RAM01673.1 dTDP-glucose 4,6-dehydratase [Desulfobacter hydrogenophilus]
MNLLITGAAGFIGTNFVYYWLKNHPADPIIALDALTYAGNRDNLRQAEASPNFEFVHGNILDQSLVETLLSTRNIDTIVHFAAESHVDRSIQGPDAFIETNIVGTHTLLKAVKNIWLNKYPQPRHRFHHISTDEVYGSLKPDDPPFSENTPYAPNSPYAASKAASDHLVRAYHKTFGLETTISNCSNNFGPFQFPEKLIPLMITNILAGKPIPVYGDGQQIRDWLYVDDHNQGVDLILKKGRSGQVYNIGGNNEQTNLDIIHMVCDLMNNAFTADPGLAAQYPDCPCTRSIHPSTLITHVTDRKGHDRRYAINATKIQTQLAFTPEHTFNQGLQKTLNWYLTKDPGPRI